MPSQAVQIPDTHGSTERCTDLDKLKFVMVVGFKFEPIFNTAPAVSKNDAYFKSSQNRLENNHIASLV